MGKIVYTALFLSFMLLSVRNVLAREARAVLHVSGMTCNMCQITIRHRVLKMKGVKEAVVDRKTDTAVVTFDDALETPKAIAGAITELGYPAVVKKGAK